MDGFGETYAAYCARVDREVELAEAATPVPHQRVLVIDDMRVITGLPVDAVVVRTLKRASRVLFSQPWDVVYLDHDLGYTLDGDTQTIRPLVADLERRVFEGRQHPIGKVVVITDNPVGRIWITSALDKAYDVEQARPDCTYDYDAHFAELREEAA